MSHLDALRGHAVDVCAVERTRHLDRDPGEAPQLVEQLGRPVAQLVRRLKDAGVRIGNGPNPPADSPMAMCGLGSLLGLLNTFLDLVGLPEVPDLTTLAKLPLGEILVPLNDLVAALRTVRAAIP